MADQGGAYCVPLSRHTSRSFSRHLLSFRFRRRREGRCRYPPAPAAHLRRRRQGRPSRLPVASFRVLFSVVSQQGPTSPQRIKSLPSVHSEYTPPLLGKHLFRHSRTVWMSRRSTGRSSSPINVPLLCARALACSSRFGLSQSSRTCRAPFPSLMTSSTMQTGEPRLLRLNG